MSVVQQWLDGEASEADARLADAPAVTFWTRFDADMASHRQAKAPAHLAAAIMAAIARAESGGSLTATPRADLAPPRDG